MIPDPPIQRAHRPIDLPTASPLLLFFGGSFDPPHLGHAQLPTQAAGWLEDRLGEARGSCHLVFVPTARSPHKDQSPSADEHRLAMLDLALVNLDRPYGVWIQELEDAPLNPAQPSYWADTWAIAASLAPKSAKKFLIGADQALSMHRWHRYEEYWKDAIVLMRDESDSVDRLIETLHKTGAWSLDDLDHWRSWGLTLPMVPWSSTSIRGQISSIDQKKDTRIQGLDPGVESYILARKLYR